MTIKTKSGNRRVTVFAQRGWCPILWAECVNYSCVFRFGSIYSTHSFFAYYGVGSQDPLFYFYEVLNMKEIEEKIHATIHAVIDPTPFKLVAVEVRPFQSRQQVRVYLDSEQGITIDQCRQFSRQIESIIDAQGLLGTQYILEVSSPGVERPIVEEWQFRKNVGRPILVRYRTALLGE